MKKKIKYLVLHCTATPEGRNVTPTDIIHWHTMPTKAGGRGWKQVGYSDLFMLDGTRHSFVVNNNDDFVDPWEITNGVAGINSISRSVVYAGGTDRYGKPQDTRTAEQLIAMKEFVLDQVRRHPGILVAGHNQFAQKACPSFDVPVWLRSIGVKEENIYKPDPAV